jgi:hypothetical protein
MTATSLEHAIALDPPLPAPLRGELERRLYFVSDEIVDFTLGTDGGAVDGVVLRTHAPASTDDLARKVRAIVEQEVRPQRVRDAKTVWEVAPAQPIEPDTYERMVAGGIAAEAAEGQVTLGEPMLALIDYLDRELRAIAVERFGAVEYRYPTLIPVAVLQRAGYVGAFPQYLMFVTRLHADLDVYREFLDEAARVDDVAELLLDRCEPPDLCLPPTMCFHTYHQLRERTLPAPSLVVTSVGKSFRFESRYRKGLERLWDFTIREIVFLGPRPFPDEARRRFMRDTIELAERLGLAGRCELANDPFFAGDDVVTRTWSQQLLELKYELRLHVDDARTIAVASFNFHEGFFAGGFEIGGAGGEPVETGCVGIGLERLAYAFVCQHGLDERAWPIDVRAHASPGRP